MYKTTLSFLIRLSRNAGTLRFQMSGSLIPLCVEELKSTLDLWGVTYESVAVQSPAPCLEEIRVPSSELGKLQRCIINHVESGDYKMSDILRIIKRQDAQSCAFITT
jgi:hypothetical protein